MLILKSKLEAYKLCTCIPLKLACQLWTQQLIQWLVLTYFWVLQSSAEVQSLVGQFFLLFSGLSSANVWNVLAFFVNHFSINNWNKSAVTIYAVARHVLDGKRYVAGIADAIFYIWNGEPYLERMTHRCKQTKWEMWNNELSFSVSFYDSVS